MKRWKIGAIIGLIFAILLSIPAFFCVYIDQYIHYLDKFAFPLLILIVLPSAITILFFEKIPFLFIIPTIIQYTLLGTLIGKIIDAKGKRIFWIIILILFVIVLILVSLLSFFVVMGPGS